MARSRPLVIVFAVTVALFLIINFGIFDSTGHHGSPVTRVSPKPARRVHRDDDVDDSERVMQDATTAAPVQAAVDVEGDADRGSDGEFVVREQKPLQGSTLRKQSSGKDDCGFISFLLCRFIDIDFIEFVLSSHPQPQKAKIVDIGVYQGGELVHMAKQGFQVDAYEPNPFRFNKSLDEINALQPNVRSRIRLNQNAVADRRSKLYFQRAGLDSHIYFPEDETKLKPQTIVVEGIPIADAITENKYFVKIDTQGFDTRIVENLLDALEKTGHTVTFIQFEFSPHFEVTRAHRTKEDHRRTLRRLLDAGYDVYQGAAVQPWIKSHRSTYGKTPLAMLSPAGNVPTCVNDFVDFMHSGRERPIHPGKTSTDAGTWMDVLAVKRVAATPYWRHTGWVLARHM